MPDPNTEGYVGAVIDAAWPVVRASGGHAFLLFTSLRAMERGFERLAVKLAAEAWSGRCCCRDGFEERAARAFPPLAATRSWWVRSRSGKGVDVKGEQLSVVVIDRLPFNPPDDPVLAACIERINRAGGNAFMDYQVPRAVITLKQGAGRLIRDETDRGALMICDPRLVEKPYGRRIWRALPRSGAPAASRTSRLSSASASPGASPRDNS
jgi:ATP-dependent DNA helicase DinG